MSNLSNTEKQENALRVLEAAGFDVKQLWRELGQRTAQAERGTPGEDDSRYLLPEVAPAIAQHLAEGTNEELSPSVLWNGYSYTLTPGQRGLLRDRYDLTPTMTVTCTWVEPWPGTRHPRRMKLKSDVHIDPRARKHVLTEVVVNEVGTFFRLAAERDANEANADGSLSIEKTLVLGDIAKLKTEERWAIEDLCGVKVETKVEVVKSSESHFTVVCIKTGNKATVERKAFFETSSEYLKMNAQPRKGKKKVFDATPVLDAMIEDLFK